MFLQVALVLAASVCCYAAPEPKPGVLAAYAAAPFVAAPAVVTAQSSQVVARNFNTLAAPLVAAAPAVAYTAPFLNAAPVVAAHHGFAAPYVAAAPAFHYSSPLIKSLPAPLVAGAPAYYL